MYTSCYRAKLLVEYFDEHLLLKIYLVDVKTHWLLCFFLCSLHVKDVCLCFSVDFLPRFFSGCDICIKGPPERQNLEAEAMIILQVVATHCRNFADISYGGYEGRLGESPNIKALVGKIREQCQQFSASDLLWWRGLA
ncbi:ATP-dependent DNA helicase Q-like SIM isoform X2 [Solanum lycopersicum]